MPIDLASTFRSEQCLLGPSAQWPWRCPSPVRSQDEEDQQQDREAMSPDNVIISRELLPMIRSLCVRLIDSRDSHQELDDYCFLLTGLRHFARGEAQRAANFLILESTDSLFLVGLHRTCVPNSAAAARCPYRISHDSGEEGR